MLIAQLLLTLFLGLLDAQILSPLLPVLAEEFGVSPAQMGAVVTGYACAAAMCALVIGPLSDRWGRVMFLRAATVLLGLASATAFFAPRFEIYFGARLLAGLAGGTISACVLAQIADAFTFEKRGRAMGWVGAIYSIAAILGVPLAAWISGQWRWRVIYLVIAGAAPALGLALRAHPARAAATQRALGREIFLGYLRYCSDATTRTGLLLASMISATAAALLTFLGAFLAKSFGMTIAEIGWIFFAAGAASTAGALLGGLLADRVGKRRMVLWCSFALALLLPGLAYASTTFPLYLLVVAAGVLLAGREGPYQALISELVAPAERGAYIALRNAASQLAIALGVAAAGYLYSRHGFGAVTYFAAGLSLAAALLAGLMKEPRKNSSRE